MLTDTVTKQIGEALKAHDEVRLSTLRLLSSAFNYERIAKQHVLSDEEGLAVIMREAKKRRESIEAYKGARGKGTFDPSSVESKLKREEDELKILQEFLPEQMSNSDLEVIIKEEVSKLGNVSSSDFGRVMGAIMPKVKGKADGNRVTQIVKKILE